LVSFSIIVVLIMPFTVVRSFQAGAQYLAYCHLFLGSEIIITTLFRHRLSLKARTVLFLSPLVASGILGLATWGLIGMGGFFLIIATIFISILTYGNWAKWTTILSLCAIALVGALVVAGVFTRDLDYQAYAYRPSSWLNYLGAFALFGFSIIAALDRFHQALRDSIENLEARVHERTSELESANRTLSLSEMVFKNTAEGIMVTDANGKIVSVNRAFSQITGYPKNEILGNTPRKLQSGRHNLEFYQAFWKALQTTGQWKGELWNKRKNGEIYPQDTSITQVTKTSGEVLQYVAVFSDITERKRAEAKIEHMASHDLLTGLPNRALFHDRLTVALRVARRSRTMAAVLFVDLDGFKQVNDRMGHSAGDALLQQVSIRLRSLLRESDTVARYGGDEFMVLLVNVPQISGATVVAEKILNCLVKPFRINSSEVHIGASVGIVVYPTHGEQAEEMLDKADAAMYRVKQAGKNSFAFADAEIGKTPESGRPADSPREELVRPFLKSGS
jgi:diguanylate cyclase (GGDEF)-like protein/PAS domain S-box-containing protein